MAGDHVRTGLALPAALDEVHALLEEVGEAHADVSALDLMRLETALIELVGNIIEHGRPPGEVRYAVSVTVEPEELVAVLTDTAAVLAPSPGSQPAAEEWAEAGRGLALAEAIVDELRHDPNHPGNRWRLRQRRSA